MWKFVLFLLLACALTFAVAWVPGVDRLLGSVLPPPMPRDTLRHMRVVNVRKLHEQTGAIVDMVAEGNVVIVVKHGRPVAELRPADARSAERTLPERGPLLARFPRLKGDSGRYLEEDRS